MELLLLLSCDEHLSPPSHLNHHNNSGPSFINTTNYPINHPPNSSFTPTNDSSFNDSSDSSYCSPFSIHGALNDTTTNCPHCFFNRPHCSSSHSIINYHHAISDTNCSPNCSLIMDSPGPTFTSINGNECEIHPIHPAKRAIESSEGDINDPNHAINDPNRAISVPNCAINAARCGVNDGLTTMAMACREESPCELQELLKKQSEYMPQGDYLYGLRAHNLIQSRSKSIQWIVEAQGVFHYNTTTIALAINYFDRYLSKHLATVQSTCMFELLALTCLSTAVKMEETSMPRFTSLQVGALEHTFDISTLKKMELLLLQALQWKLRSITTISFVDLVLSEANMCEKLRQMVLANASTLVLRTMSEGQFVEFCPSLLAACGIHLVVQKMDLHGIMNIMSENKEKLLANQDDNIFVRCCKLMENTIKDTIPSLNDCCGNQSPISVLCDAMNGHDSAIQIDNASVRIPCLLDVYDSKREQKSMVSIHTLIKTSKKRTRRRRSLQLHI